MDWDVPMDPGRHPTPSPTGFRIDTTGFPMKKRTIVAAVLALLWVAVPESQALEKTNLLETVIRLGLPRWDKPMVTYHSEGSGSARGNSRRRFPR